MAHDYGQFCKAMYDTGRGAAPRSQYALGHPLNAATL